MKAYAGPRGTVRGRVIAIGDPPPDQPEVLAKIPEQCGKGREAYAKLFREHVQQADEGCDFDFLARPDTAKR